MAFWHLYPLHNRFTSLFINCVLGLFIYISGYLAATQNRFENIGNVFKYYRNRFFRIYPLFFASLTIFLMMGVIGPDTYLKSAFMTNMFIREHLMTLWFITMLFILYAVAPFFLYNYSSHKTILLLSGFWISLVAIHFLTDYIDLRLPMYMIPFTLGIMMGRSLFVEQIVNSKYAPLACLAVFLSALWQFSQKRALFELIIIDVAILASIPIFLFFGRLLTVIVPTRLTLFVSYASFVMYLSHKILFTFFGKFYHSFSIHGQVLYYGCFVLPVMIVLSYLIQLFYDKMTTVKI